MFLKIFYRRQESREREYDISKPACKIRQSLSLVSSKNIILLLRLQSTNPCTLISEEIRSRTTMAKTTTPSSSSSRPSSTIVIAGLYLLLVAPFSSAQPSQCPPIEYCGGDHGYPESEISCTAFPARFDASGESWYDAACGHPNISLLTGGDPYGAKAWRDSGKKDDHYWVFHGCDKAGTSE